VQADVFDVTAGQSWTLGSGATQAEASVVKLNVLETLMAQNQAGLPGQDASLAQSMIEYSDNDAATSLWNTVGGASGIGSFNSRVGLSSTTPSPCVDCPGFAWPGWGLTTTSAADQILLLRQLVQPNQFLSDSQQSFALQLMENVTASEGWGVSGGVTPGTTIALKNGWLPLNDAETDWQINSIGWISGSGRNYLIAVLTTGNPTEQYGIDTIDGLSSLVWQAMS
jgi:beta-lactamase class A